MPFYKRTDAELLTAKNFVHGPGFILLAEHNAEYVYPVDGWYWFDNLDVAMSALTTQATQSVTMRQGRLALLSAGLLEQVDSAIAAIFDPLQRKAAQIEWEYARTIDRNSEFAQQVAAGLGLTDVQMDALFSEAALL